MPTTSILNLPQMPYSTTRPPASPSPPSPPPPPRTKSPAPSPPPSVLPTESAPSSSPQFPPSSTTSQTPRKRRVHLSLDLSPSCPFPKRLQLNRSGKSVRTGNYRGYYHRRLGRSDASTDSRLSLLSPSWVSPPGRILDIGCNDGAFTFEVARRFPTAHVTGLDIDASLVARATQRVRTALTSSASATASAAQPACVFPANATFVAGDVSDPAAAPSVLSAGPYDLVLALSVSKWIHLHGGDEGLRRFFARVLAALAPGGVFVLEPQPSRSYKKARQRGAVPRDRTMNTFKLRPEQFSDYLVSKQGGFDRVVTLREVQGKNTPFGNRPVFAFFKPLHSTVEGA